MVRSAIAVPDAIRPRPGAYAQTLVSSEDSAFRWPRATGTEAFRRLAQFNQHLRDMRLGDLSRLEDCDVPKPPIGSVLSPLVKIASQLTRMIVSRRSATRVWPCLRAVWAGVSPR